MNKNLINLHHDITKEYVKFEISSLNSSNLEKAKLKLNNFIEENCQKYIFQKIDKIPVFRLNTLLLKKFVYFHYRK